MLWLVLVALIGVLIYFKVIKPLSYWKDKGIPYIKPWPIVGNNAPMVFRTKPIIDIVQDFYNAFPGERYNGLHQFTTPILLIRDLDLIKQITIKDFDYFIDHNPIITEDVDPLMGKNLFALQGQRWRDMRATMSPCFTSSKMKAMFLFLSECSEQFTKYYEKQGSNITAVEMKDAFTRFTNDAIASIAFGLKVDSLEDRTNYFYTMGKDATDFSGLRTLKFFLFNLSPTLCKLAKIQFFSKPVSDFFRRMVRESIQLREQTGLVRPDLIHLLMEARKGRLNHEQSKETIDAGFATVEESHVGKMERHQKPQLSDDDITAQAVIFFFAGFETVATLMCFISYELAVNPDVQEKLQSEVDETLEKCNGKITYEALMKMKYLDMVVSETLRKWPLAIQMDRLCVKDYTIKPQNPSEKPLEVKKGDLLIVSLVGIHRDPKYFPNPDKFDPERFSEENKHKILPFSYMPFGAGPRNCIASRLALLENKTLIFHLLSKFNITVVEKTSIPLKLGSKGFNLMPDDGFWLGLQQRKAN